jgi:hypothetical protein
MISRLHRVKRSRSEDVFETRRAGRWMSVDRGKAEVCFEAVRAAFDPEQKSRRLSDIQRRQ